MDYEVFEEINNKLIEIMNFIEKQKNFPIMSKDISTYCEESDENYQLMSIYLEIAKLRDI